MTTQAKYTYRDFITGKVRFTRGKFAGWTEETGLVKVPYAIFDNPKSTVFVPVYLLTPETRAAIGNPPEVQQHETEGEQAQ